MCRITSKIFLVLIWLVNFAGVCFSDAGYITTYTHHMRKGEVEIMLMTDFTSPSEHKRKEEGQRDYFSHMIELEYYPTNQLVFEFMVEGFEDVNTGEEKFTGFRYETRYRPFKKEVLLNPTLYAEYEDLDPKTRYKMEVSGWIKSPYNENEGEEPIREKILETRLILSQDISQLNAAFNWINETDSNSGETAFGYSMGISFLLHSNSEEHDNHKEMGQQNSFRPASLNFELFGALGDTKNFALKPDRQEHYFQASLMFHGGKHTMLNFGFAIGLTESSDDIVRISVGWEIQGVQDEVKI